MYINDIPEAIEGLVKIFADDTKVYRAIESTETPELLQNDVSKSEYWGGEWKMFYNTDKCHHVHIGENTEASKYEMGSGDNRNTIKRVESEKDLGVFIDEKLNFRDHITKKVNIANRNLGIIFRSFAYMDKEMFLNLYKSMVRPHIEYATQVWSPQYKKDKITLENVQRRATRLVKCIKHLSYSERLKALGLPTLEYRRERADMIQVYKILHDIDKADMEKLFQMAAYTSTRGHPLKLFKKRCRLNLRKNYFSQRVIDQWNGLPTNLVTAPSLYAFKSRLNKFWKDHPFKFRAACYLTEDEARQGKQPRKASEEAT